MMCNKQKELFVTKDQHQSSFKSVNTKNTMPTVISHNNSTKESKLSITKNLMVVPDKSPLKTQADQFVQVQKQGTTRYIREQRQQYNMQQHENSVSKVFQQEPTSLDQQAMKGVHVTLKEYFEFSNSTTNAAPVTTTKTRSKTSTRLNKNICVQQNKQHSMRNNSRDTFSMITSSEQHHQLNLRPTIANTDDPLKIEPNAATIPSSLSSPFLLTPSEPTTATLQLPDLNVAALAKVLNMSVTGDVARTIQKQMHNNVCINSKCYSKQTFLQQQKQKRQCKTVNTCSNKKCLNNIRTFSKTNINAHRTDDKADVDGVPTVTTAVQQIKYFSATTTSTTNKSNNVYNTTASTSTAPDTDNDGFISASAARPSESTTATPYCTQFPLQQLFYKNTKQLECFLRAVVFSLVFIVSMQFQTVSASGSMLNKHEPMFISRSETFKFVAGDTIVLPCEVANTDPYVVAWKRGIAILTAGSVKVTPDPRVRLVSGFNLQILDAVPQDAGDYICQIATMEPREITHTVEILVPPRIHHISTSGHLQVKKGSSVRIECSASGNPTPNVTWSRKNNILPNGEEKLHSHILSIENVDRHKGGVYICTANNGVGQPASSQVVLHVLYPPEITVERPVVFSGEGHEAMLVCIVHGETQPEVIWFKDTMQLDTTERHIMENRGSRHTLIIRKVHPQDFGNYSCVAENQLGKSRKTLQLSGKPNVAVFNSPPISQYKDRYNISWSVESHTPIEEYKLSFRRLQQGQEVDNSIDTHSSSMLQLYGSSIGNLGGVNSHNYRQSGISSMNSKGGGGGYGSYGTGNIIHWGRNDWRDVVLPAIPTSHHYTQGMSYMIRGLDPDQHYEATVQARNRYGWSDYSQSFVFSTSSNDNEMRDLSVTFYGSKTSRLQIISRHLIITIAASLCVFNFKY